jgi:hypothetical protein
MFELIQNLITGEVADSLRHLKPRKKLAVFLGFPLHGEEQQCAVKTSDNSPLACR